MKSKVIEMLSIDSPLPRGEYDGSWAGEEKLSLYKHVLYVMESRRTSIFTVLPIVDQPLFIEDLRMAFSCIFFIVGLLSF